jgi:hypothetical protein
MSLPGHISKLEASLDRAYPAPVAGVRATDSASTTAADIREHREREMRAANVRRIVGVKLRVAKGLVALAGKDFEKAGRELGEVGEEGGLGDWEGQVNPKLVLRCGRYAIGSAADPACRQYQPRTSRPSPPFAPSPLAAETASAASSSTAPHSAPPSTTPITGSSISFAALSMRGTATSSPL